MYILEHLEISTKDLTYFGLLYGKWTVNFWMKSIQALIIGILYDPKIMLQKSYLFMHETAELTLVTPNLVGFQVINWWSF